MERLSDTGTELQIVTQPEDYTGAAGDFVTFTIEAEGNDLSYQWQYSDDGETWKMGSSTTASYSTMLTEARSGRMIRCIVTDAEGNSVTSDVATMTIGSEEIGLTIVTQPENYVGASGDFVTFTIEAEGNDLSYRWQFSSDGGETWKTGSKADSFSATPM